MLEPHAPVTRLFVYGTLRPASGTPIACWLQEHAEWLGEARCRGRLFDLGGYPGLVTARGWVVGDVLALEEPRRVLGVLDRYEGIHPTGRYLRRRRRVLMRVGTTVTAWCYVLVAPVPGAIPIPSGDYLESATSR